MIPLFLAGVLAVAGLLAFTTGRNMLRNYELGQEEAKLRRELEQLKREHEQLSGIREYLRSDEYVEDVARRTLGLVKPGETLVIVSAPEGEAASPVPQPTPGVAWWKSLFSIAEPTPTAPPLLAP